MGRIAGVDFGTVRLGVAVSDERKIIATALPTVQAAKTREETVKRVVACLAPYQPLEKLVVGNPLLLSGKEGEMAVLARTFGEALGQALQVPVILWDERLTSAQVDRFLKEADVSRKKRAALSDQMAAVAILQNYLDSL